MSSCVVFLAVVVLLQSGKAADLAGAFGGMGSQTVFGPRGSATMLSKATTISAVLFMLTSLTLSIMATRGGSTTPDLLKKALPAAGQTAPAQSKAPVQPGGTVPISVQGGVQGGEKSAPSPGTGDAGAGSSAAEEVVLNREFVPRFCRV